MAFNCYMHPRNIYRVRPDFEQLASEFPEFSQYTVFDERGRVHVNFKDASTLRCLTKTLLSKDFGLKVSIPENCLIPTVPQRLNYILWIEDLLNALPSTGNVNVEGIDIGTGPCCVFALLGAKKNGWKFLATESEDESIKWATKNVVENELQGQIEIRKVNKEVILKSVVGNDEKKFDFCMCNPPFFHDLDEMQQRKKTVMTAEVENLKVKETEVMVQGGEVQFIRRMIMDSAELKEKITIYTSMFGKKKSLIEIKNDLRNLGNVNFAFTEFCQGNTMRWGVAWTFMEGINLSQVYCSKRKKKKKPMNFLIPKSVKGYSIKNMLQRVVAILQELSIQHEVKTETRLNVILSIQSNENTWSHQRRRRRQAQQLVKKSSCVCSEDNEMISHDTEGTVITRDISENLPESLAVDKSQKDCSTCRTEGSVETSETPFQVELVEYMDTEVSSGEDSFRLVKGTAEVTSLAGASVEDMSIEVQSSTTVPLSDSLISDMDSSIVRNKNCCNVTEVLSTDSHSKNSTGTINIGDKRKHDPEDLTEDHFVKHAKMKSDGTLSSGSAVTASSPLLFCDLELKRHCDKIMLEMSCEEHCNRQSMSEVLQLFKNRFK